MKYFVLIIFILAIQVVSAIDIYVIETNGKEYNISVQEGIVTQKEEGEYRAELIGYKDYLIHKQYFDVKETKDSFPSRNCFDEEKYLDFEKCPSPFSVEEINSSAVINVPKLISGKYINIYEGEELIFSINVSVKVGADPKLEKETNTKMYLITGIILLLIIIIGLIIFKNKR